MLRVLKMSTPMTVEMMPTESNRHLQPEEYAHFLERWLREHGIDVTTEPDALRLALPATATT